MKKYQHYDDCINLLSCAVAAVVSQKVTGCCEMSTINDRAAIFQVISSICQSREKKVLRGDYVHDNMIQCTDVLWCIVP